MSDEVKATSCGCGDNIFGDNDWLEWLIILGVIFFLVGGNNFFGRGCR